MPDTEVVFLSEPIKGEVVSFVGDGRVYRTKFLKLVQTASSKPGIYRVVDMSDRAYVGPVDPTAAPPTPVDPFTAQAAKSDIRNAELRWNPYGHLLTLANIFEFLARAILVLGVIGAIAWTAYFADHHPRNPGLAAGIFFGCVGSAVLQYLTFSLIGNGIRLAIDAATDIRAIRERVQNGRQGMP